jgi:YD repeat-containing protein
VGNRLVREADGSLTTFTYDAANQITTHNGLSFEYDGAGNLTTYDSGTQPTTRIYHWDDDNRLAKVEAFPNIMTTMMYNADGLRVRVETDPSTEFVTLNKIWDLALGSGAPMIAEASGTTAVRKYAHKPDHRTGLELRNLFASNHF